MKTKKTKQRSSVGYDKLHKRLWEACLHPGYYEWWRKLAGQTKDEWLSDCSCGCRWYHRLDGDAGADWGVCLNLQSPRKGLLTFEHTGCRCFEDDRKP